jgi:5-methylcytosine-specific restriction enzyme B
VAQSYTPEQYERIKGGLGAVKNKPEPTVDELDASLLLAINKKQIILYGPPGTGKTYNTRKLSTGLLVGMNMTNIDDDYSILVHEDRIRFITFHPSYSYEEFVEGITVKVERDPAVKQNTLEYYLKDGIFKQMAKEALMSALEIKGSSSLTMTQLLDLYQTRLTDAMISPQGDSFGSKDWWKARDRYVLIIDEINRGDMSKILGELITLLEADKRLGMENQLIVTLPYSRDRFSIPPNLYIIGTMNTADKSVALVDVALRRRFGFVEMAPDFELLRKIIASRRPVLGDDLFYLLSSSTDALQKINERIATNHSIGRDKCIGHAFFLKVESIDDLLMVWRNEIIPTIEEYCYGRQKELCSILLGDGDWVDQFDNIKGFIGLKDVQSLPSFLEGVKRG